MESDATALERVVRALAGHGLDVRASVLEGRTGTAAEAAAVAGCELGQIVKTLALFVAGAPLLVLVAGDRRLDDRLVAARFGVGRKQVRLASPAEVLDLTGYSVGGVSPFRLPRRLDVLVDAALTRFEIVWIAGGTPSAILPLATADLLRLSGGETAAVAT
jgi:prolyl-tRNA editing enzyme YbaK/EbsC (Cys-tRNA(Pro) deacylase)